MPAHTQLKVFVTVKFENCFLLSWLTLLLRTLQNRGPDILFCFAFKQKGLDNLAKLLAYLQPVWSSDPIKHFCFGVIMYPDLRNYSGGEIIF